MVLGLQRIEYFLLGKHSTKAYDYQKAYLKLQMFFYFPKSNTIPCARDSSVE